MTCSGIDKHPKKELNLANFPTPLPKACSIPQTYRSFENVTASCVLVLKKIEGGYQENENTCADKATHLQFHFEKSL